MRFTKMHGIGNDYVFVDGFAEEVEHPAATARVISDRHRGVGGDGLILIQPPSSRQAHCRMEMYNADGSRAEMCGNGIRCVAKYVYEHGIAREEDLSIETDAGRKNLRLLLGAGGEVDLIEVDMGPPGLARSEIPFVDGGVASEPAIHVPLEVGGHTFRVTTVAMGNPHAVVRLDGTAPPPAEGFENVDAIALSHWGPLFENHSAFPQRTNTEFVTCPSRSEMEFRVWERGSGETLACGTGACAAVVAGALNGWCDPEVLVHLRGGDLRIRWEREGEFEGHVFMTGPAEEVFSGEWKGATAPAR